MGKVLYTALDKQGKEKNGFIDALNNKEALQLLKESGLEQIELHLDAALTFERDDLQGIGDKELSKIAKFEIQMQKDAGLLPYIEEILRNNGLPMLIGAGMVGYGVNENSAWWMAAGVILTLFIPFFSLWNYNLLQTHQSLYKALSFGEWEDVKELSHSLKSRTKNQDVIIEADTLLAYYHAHNQDMDSAIKVMMQHKEYLDQKPGIYENKIGSIYFYNKNYDQSLFHIKQAYIVSKGNTTLVDWILAEARFGDINIAKDNLEKIDIEQVPPYGIPFLDYTEGIIAYKYKNFQESKHALLSAIDGFSAYDKNPALWGPLAMVNVMLALVLDAMNEKENAEKYLSDGVVKIAQEHAETELLKELKDRFPTKF